MAIVSLTGCVGESEEQSPGEDVGVETGAVISGNSLTSNSLTSNSLTSNSLTSSALTSTSLTSSALASNPLLLGALADSRSRDVLKYVVGCALDKADKVEVTVGGRTYRYRGELGLATWWKHLPCDEDCRIRVSSCVLARLNHEGIHVTISVAALGLGRSVPEILGFPRPEAVYFGNIFKAPQERYLCLPRFATEVPRVCGPSLDGCVVQSTGPCACLFNDPFSGRYANCANFGDYNDRAITVFLPEQ